MYSALMGKLNARRKGLLSEDEKGFTLIELLVVVIIIGILAAIAIPVYLGVQKNAQDSATQSDVANFKTAVVSIQTNLNQLPNTAANVTITDKPSAGTGAAAVASTQSWADAGATKTDKNTKTLKYTAGTTNGSFCVVGTSTNDTQYYATDTLGATKVANGAALPAGC